MDAPEDVLADSLESLYDHVPVAHSSAGTIFTFRSKIGGSAITLMTPDTQAANWSLHATSIWSSSLYVADHIEDLNLSQYTDSAMQEGRPLRVLELGAGAGLPSILISQIYTDALVTCSDYPDPELIRTLTENAQQNKVQDRCRVVPYAWGSDPNALMESQSAQEDPIPGFDIVLAADTLWNLDTHHLFIQTLQLTLKRSSDARVHLVAGLHTGRYVVQSFLKLVTESGFVAEDLRERRVGGTEERPWSVDRADGEEEQERRRWVVWMVFRRSDC